LSLETIDWANYWASEIIKKTAVYLWNVVTSYASLSISHAVKEDPGRGVGGNITVRYVMTRVDT